MLLIVGPACQVGVNLTPMVKGSGSELGSFSDPILRTVGPVYLNFDAERDHYC